MKELTTYRCDICGNLVCMIEDSGVTPSCCGQEMTLVTANTVDADREKHLPVTDRQGSDVQIVVGSLPHPMTLQHHISLIFLLTDKGVYVRCLGGSTIPEAMFSIKPDENIIAVYALCNIHGLWKS